LGTEGMKQIADYQRRPAGLWCNNYRCKTEATANILTIFHPSHFPYYRYFPLRMEVLRLWS
jgi:hypothetical protein